MARIYVKIGDLFSVPIGDRLIRFFQYIGNDSTQLDSEIIRAYKHCYNEEDPLDLATVIAGEIDWHAHCFLKLGLKLNYWLKAGNAAISPGLPLLFRDTYDYGRATWQEPITVSHNWVVWQPGQAMRQVGRLAGQDEQAEIGLVMSPADIVYRMKHDKYNMPFYPSF